VSRVRRVRRFSRVLLPVNLLAAAAVVACLEYPVFRLNEIEVTYADGREVPAGVYDQVCQVVGIAPDSNLFSIKRQEVARALLQDENIVRVDLRLSLPGRLLVRLHAAQPLLWWADCPVLPLGVDGRAVATPGHIRESGYPIGGAETKSMFARWRLLEFYQQLTEHDSRWAGVISQINCDPHRGWELILNGGAERVLLGWHPGAEILDRVVGFLKAVPEVQWKHGMIDARFSRGIIVTPRRDKSHGAHKPYRTAGRDNSPAPFGGRS